ncbi:unnamed protein product [Mytilus edulis]|uniref:EGF-like domain-containing protein n=1 Tax=Mytilus edulis TaxID=6550 RepID=A0A8S3Q9G5_MYTED|nr:unnamed protein product [Mytilus edulis]
MVLVDQNGTNFAVIAKDDMLDIHNFAYHITKNYIYWSGWCGNITRFKYPSVDNDTEVLFHQESGCYSFGIAVDSINDFLYWSNHNDLVRSNLDGSDITSILNFSTNGSIGMIEVDSEKGLIFFINKDDGSIVRCTVDGSDVRSIFSSGSVQDFALGNRDCKTYSEMMAADKRSKDYLIEKLASDQVISDEYLDQVKTPPNSSFCFGSGPVICPVGTSSETGFYPGCSSSYPTTRVSVAVQTELLEGSSLPIPGYDPTPSLLPVFRCKFDEEPNGTYIYDIYWYINEFKITSYTNIPMKDINITLLKHTDWIDSYKMNMEVQCAIRMRYLANSVPGPLQYSAKFKAGIFVKVLDKDASMTSRLCQSVNDPHISTFDGKYYHFMEIGEFIMYRNDKGPYWIILPIGTEIKISISRWSGFIGTVTVKPSIYDINEAKGLCGVPSVTKDPSDDYTHRFNGPISSDQEFAKSWSINNSTTFCTCEDQAGSTDSLDDFNILQCNLTESTEFCSSSQQSGNQINSYSTTCTISKRKRRSLDHSSVVRRSTADTDDSDDVTESQPLVFDEDINSTDVISQTFRNGWTAETAYQTCQEALTTAIPSDVYSDVVEVDVENFIQSCVSDIEVTGDKSFLTDTINAMATNIMTEISRNESLFIVNTTDGSQTILEQITSKLCINNCSNNGICVSGQCECSNEYIGDDCSKDTSTPPVNISLPAEGLCTTTTRSCKKTNIYGDFLSMEVWYKIRYFKVVENSKLYSSNWEIYKAQYRNMFMVTVDLGVSRKLVQLLDLRWQKGCVSCNSSMICVSLEVCESSKDTAENDEDSTTTIIAVASSCGVIGVIVGVLALLFYLKYKHTGEKSKVGVYSGCQHENGKNMDNGMLSNRTEQFRENTISDLDVHFEEGKEASMSNFENQLPPQNHFQNN